MHLGQKETSIKEKFCEVEVTGKNNKNMTGKNWRFWTNSAIFSPSIIPLVMIKTRHNFPE